MTNGKEEVVFIQTSAFVKVLVHFNIAWTWGSHVGGQLLAVIDASTTRANGKLDRPALTVWRVHACVLKVECNHITHEVNNIININCKDLAE